MRCSSFYLCRVDGVFDAWDVIHRSDRPVLTTKVALIINFKLVILILNEKF